MDAGLLCAFEVPLLELWGSQGSKGGGDEGLEGFCGSWGIDLRIWGPRNADLGFPWVGYRWCNVRVNVGETFGVAVGKVWVSMVMFGVGPKRDFGVH